MTRTAFTIEYTPPRAPRRRVRYEPRADGDGFWRIEEHWNGCGWRIIGREPVTDVVSEPALEV